MRGINVVTLSILFFFLGSFHTTMAQNTQRQLVIVASDKSSISNLSQTELRRLFLGVIVIKNGIRIRPICNISSDVLYEVFLQKVIFMSARQYERHLLTRIFRHGGKKPAMYKNTKRIINELETNPNSISFMWEKNVIKTTSIKVIQPLWSGQID